MGSAHVVTTMLPNGPIQHIHIQLGCWQNLGVDIHPPLYQFPLYTINFSQVQRAFVKKLYTFFFAHDALQEMQGYGNRPDLVCLLSALLAFSQYIVRRLDFDQVLGTTVIKMYSKCGALSWARTLFDQINCKGNLLECNDNQLWNSWAWKRSSITLPSDDKNNSKPDHATFSSILSAFSHSGLVEEGQYWFNHMVSEYKVPRTEKHYVCMVDLLAGVGQVEKACELIDSMNAELGLAVWVALLAGCCKNNMLFIGEMAAKKVLELNPDDLGIYSLVSNYHEKARKCDDVASVRKIVKKTGMKKVPGYSVVEVKGKLHSFLMEDKNDYQYEKYDAIFG
ncbi:putative pentatricopeptide repeat-containing protein [Quercus suber]|uniref:Pentatricopeptide repeat-containing protein n=1 Tax=Quercus suber TaxID=58331 RepID=A0AAW0JC33_QUESU